MSTEATTGDPDPRERLAALQRQLQALDGGLELHDLTPELFRSVHRRLHGRQIDEQVRTSREEQVRQGLERLEECLAEIIADLVRRAPDTPPASMRMVPLKRPLPRRTRWPAPLTSRQPQPWTEQAHSAQTCYEDGLPLYWSPQPVLGFRFWQVDSQLEGVFRPWPQPEYEAGCSRGLGEFHDAHVPHTDGRCGEPPCGIYAAKDPASLFDEEDDHTTMRGRAYGLVALRGKVVEHERGYRAAHATALAVGVVKQGLLVHVEGRARLERLFASPPRTIAGIITYEPDRLQKLGRGLGAVAQVVAYLDRAKQAAQPPDPLTPGAGDLSPLDPTGTDRLEEQKRREMER